MKQLGKLNWFTLIKLGINVAVVGLVLITIFVMFLPPSRHRITAKHISSVNALRQISIAPSTTSAVRP